MHRNGRVCPQKCCHSILPAAENNVSRLLVTTVPDLYGIALGGRNSVVSGWNYT